MLGNPGAGSNSDLRLPGAALGDLGPRLLGNGGELFRLVARQIVGRGVPEQISKKRFRDIVPALCQRGARHADQRLAGDFFHSGEKSWTFMVPHPLTSGNLCNITRTTGPSATATWHSSGGKDTRKLQGR